MATLITGAGLIGTHAARLLVERGESVWLLERNPDLRAIASVIDPARVGLIRGSVDDLPSLTQAIREHGIGRVFHSAALLTAGIREEPLRGVQTNVVGTAAVLEAARATGVRRVVLASSSTVYYALFGEPAAVPYPEDFAMRAVSQRPTSIYAATKLCSEHLGLLYHDLYGTDVVVLRFAAVLGMWAGASGGIAGRLVRALLEPAVRAEPSVIDDPTLVWHGGDEFIDVRDAAAGAVAALDAARPGQRVYSIGTGVLHGFDDFVRAARAAVPELTIDVRVQPAGGFAGYRIARPQPSDNRAANSELGWVPTHDLESTMRDCAAFISRRGAQ